MKFNFKRIASVLTGAVMLSSTVALAAAATNTFPDPFVKASGSDAAVVYGATAASSDFVAAGKVSKALADAALAQATSTATPTATPATITGETKAVKTGSQDLYLGEYMNNTKDVFSKTELPTVLKDGKITDRDGKEYTYQQRVMVPKAKIIYGDTVDNLDTPVIYTSFENSETYDLKINFPTPVNVTKLTDKTITLFGNQYSFSGSAADLTPTSVVMFEKSQSTRINDGESKTVGDNTISVSVEDATTGTVTVNGESESVTEGSSYKINGVDLYVKNVVGPTVAGTQRYMEVYLNSNKLTLTNGSQVQSGTEDMDGTLVTIASISNKISEIKVTVTPKNLPDESETNYIKMGDALVDPVFGTVKFSLATATPDLNASTRDSIVIRPVSDTKASIQFTNYAGDRYSTDFFGISSIGLNSTYDVDDTYTYNATSLKVDTYDVATVTTEQVTDNEYILTCDGAYSQIWQITNINVGATEAKITLKDIGSSDSQVLTFSGITDSSTATLSLSSGGTSTITLASAANELVTASKACNYAYTEGGALITFSDAPYSNASTVTIQEETSYNDGEFKMTNGTALGQRLSMRVLYQAGRDGKDMRVITPITYGGTAETDYYAESVGDNDEYAVTKYGTFVKTTGDNDKTVTLSYPSEAMALGFYIGEVGSAIDSGDDDDSGSVGNIVTVKDTETAKFENKNLVVVGGSCVNTVAAKLLGSSTPLCGADFTAKAGVKANEYLVATYASPYNTGKIATLVAGYDAADTEAAVNYLVSQTVNTTVDSSTVKQTQLSVS